MFYTDLKKGRVEQGPSSEGNSEVVSERSSAGEDMYVDSDYEIEGDDLFEDNVDMDASVAKDNKKARGSMLKTFQTSRPTVVADEHDTDDETLELPDSNKEGEGRGKFRSWREENVTSPSFFVGQVFP